jgi:hypothetical protein
MFFINKGKIVAAAVAMVAGSPAMAQTSPDTRADLAKQVAAMRAHYAAMPDTPGMGPYAAIKTVDPAFPGYVIYRPKDLTALGDTGLGVVAWGNGACAADGASARLELEEIASHGYLVLAPGTIRSGPGAVPRVDKPLPPGKMLPAETKPVALTKAIDLALAANRGGGAYAGRIDPRQIAVAGHSCGGLQALAVAGDPRVATVVIQNSGIFPNGTTPIEGMEIGKQTLATIHTPVIYILGGPRDVAYENGMDDFKHIDQVPAMVANIGVGHLGTFAEPNGGAAARVVVDWLQWRLRGDQQAAKTFVGADCGLCDDPKWTIDRKGF